MTSPSPPPGWRVPGWYDDPDRSGGERWWDGHGWTAAWLPDAQPPPYYLQPPQRNGAGWIVRVNRKLENLGAGWILFIAGTAVVIIATIIAVVVIVVPKQDPSYQTGYNDALSGGAGFVGLGDSTETACEHLFQTAKLSSDQSFVDYNKFIDGCTAGMNHIGYK
jgi:Protein of unknown function (DUF2510)